MDDGKIVHDLIVWGVGFVAVQITLFIAFIYKMNLKVELMRRENELIREDNKKRNQMIDTSILELRTDLEDHKIAFEKRLEGCILNVENKVESTSNAVEKRTKETADALAKKQDAFQRSNDTDHKEIMKAVEVIKTGVGKISEDVAYMNGMFDQLRSSFKDSPKSPPKRTRKLG